MWHGEPDSGQVWSQIKHQKAHKITQRLTKRESFRVSLSTEKEEMMHSFRSGVFFVALTIAAGLIASPSEAQSPGSEGLAEFIRASYTKFEHSIPMRDGARLFTSVYVPNDYSQTYPMLMIRTPYSCAPYGADRYPEKMGPTVDIVRDLYIMVCQDVRGRFMSEGEFVNMRPHLAVKDGPGDVDESTDTYDTIEWLLANVEGHNGRVGQWGNSYPGFYTAAGVIDSHPALKAVSPNAPIADWYWDDMHHHGAFTVGMSFPFFSSFGRPRPEPTTEWPERFDFGTPDAYQFFLDLGSLANIEDRFSRAMWRSGPRWRGTLTMTSSGSPGTSCRISKGSRVRC